MKNFAIGMMMVALLTGCAVVGPGERGVRVSLGKVSTEVKDPGAYLWVPFLLGMTTMDVQVQKDEVESSAASKDMQEITTHVAVNWSITPARVVKLYQDIGDEDDVLERIIKPAVNEIMKAAVSKRTAEEALTKRLEMKEDIDAALKARLEPYGVTLAAVNIVNFTFSKEFMDAIERKQVAEQEAKQAEYSAQKAIQEAKAQVNLAKGQAEAQQLQKQTITPAILQKMAIEKWNGEFPQYMGAGQLPFLQMQVSNRAQAQ